MHEFDEAQSMINESLLRDPSNPKIHKLAGIIYSNLAKLENDISLAKLGLEHFVEAKDLEPSLKSTRNCLLSRKLVFIINRNLLFAKLKPLITYLNKIGIDESKLVPFLKDFSSKGVDHIPKTFQCPLTLV